jgi:DUF4097 and DUF4098 domain-containing protein YvlB
MAKKRKIMIIVLSCILALATLAFVALALCEFDFSRIGGGKVKEKTINVIGTYKNIDVNDECADIKVVRSTYSEYRVKGYEKLGLRTEVVGNKETSTLEIIVFDTRKWFEKIFANNNDRVITVYLPANEYDLMKINTVSGDVSIDGNLNVDTIKVSTVSGRVSTNGGAPSLLVSTTSGSVTLQGEGYNSIDVTTVSGGVKATNVKAESASVQTVSGGVVFSAVTAKERILVKTTSGNVDFDYAESGSMTVETVSGRVSAKVAGVSTFDVTTVCGIVKVPSNTVGGGIFKIKTTSGNVNVSYFGTKD